MTKYQKAAVKAISEILRDLKEPMTLWSVSCHMDEAARASGKKTELFGSLYDYADYLPAGWSTAWLSTNSTSDSMLFATPPNWQPGDTNSQELLLGGGQLRYAQHN